MNNNDLYEALMQKAREHGAKYPAVADSHGTGGDIVIVDTDSGQCWSVELVTDESG